MYLRQKHKKKLLIDLKYLVRVDLGAGSFCLIVQVTERQYRYYRCKVSKSNDRRSQNERIEHRENKSIIFAYINGSLSRAFGMQLKQRDSNPKGTK